MEGNYKDDRGKLYEIMNNLMPDDEYYKEQVSKRLDYIEKHTDSIVIFNDSNSCISSLAIPCSVYDLIRYNYDVSYISLVDKDLSPIDSINQDTENYPAIMLQGADYAIRYRRKFNNDTGTIDTVERILYVNLGYWTNNCKKHNIDGELFDILVHTFDIKCDAEATIGAIV